MVIFIILGLKSLIPSFSFLISRFLFQYSGFLPHRFEFVFIFSIFHVVYRQLIAVCFEADLLRWVVVLPKVNFFLVFVLMQFK